jgi:putative pyruvate formate lyase activating enzyme
VYSDLLVLGEEAVLSPSYLVMLRGCNLQCSFCSESSELDIPPAEQATEPSAFAQKLDAQLSRYGSRVKSLNFVGGEPSASLPFIADVAVALMQLRPRFPPLFLNTNGLLSQESLSLACALFDGFIVDLKFGNETCAGLLGGWEEAPRLVERNLLSMAASEDAPLLFVRHLLLPGHVHCCTAPIIEWFSSNVPDGVFNLVTAFARFPGSRALSWPGLEERERREAIALLQRSAVRHKLVDGRE